MDFGREVNNNWSNCIVCLQFHNNCGPNEMLTEDMCHSTVRVKFHLCLHWIRIEWMLLYISLDHTCVCMCACMHIHATCVNTLTHTCLSVVHHYHFLFEVVLIHLYRLYHCQGRRVEATHDWRGLSEARKWKVLSIQESKIKDDDIIPKVHNVLVCHQPKSLKDIKALFHAEAVAPLHLLEDYPYNDPAKDRITCAISMMIRSNTLRYCSDGKIKWQDKVAR